MTPRGVRWVGSQALLVEVETLDDVLALHAVVAAHPLPGQIDLVPAACTLLIRFDSYRSAAQAVPQLEAIDAPVVNHDAGRLHEINVVYDGADLAAVGTLTGLGEDGVIDAHTRPTWRAAFSGFAPGFVYLVADEDHLDVPRRDHPRRTVPAGSVALAARFSAIYPRCSPGGWQLIGRTAARIWDIEREPPALIQPGDSVRYVAVDRLPEAEQAAQSNASAASTASVEPALEIIDAGLQSLIQDLGRPGLSHLGVSASGAADERAARQANRLVGNTASDALIETVRGGLALRAHADLVLAVTGATCGATIHGHNGHRCVPARSPFLLQAGERVAIEAPASGLRSYLAVRGGIDVPSVLGSRATDIMSGIGPEPLAAGRMLAVGRPCGMHIVGMPEPATRAITDETVVSVLRVVLGPRQDWFSAGALAVFTKIVWRVTEQSNRIGLRLAAADDDAPEPPLSRARDGELPSEGCVAGAVQVPTSGQPVLFLNDHPVTGGYPVIAVVIARDLAHAAQLGPGDRLRFSAVSVDGSPLAATPDSASRQGRRT